MDNQSKNVPCSGRISPSKEPRYQGGAGAAMEAAFCDNGGDREDHLEGGGKLDKMLLKKLA